MKRAVTFLLLMIAIATASTVALSFQDDGRAEREAAQAEAAREQAAARAREQASLKQQKATQDWIDNDRKNADSRLAAREKELREARALENEVKFKALQASAKELMDLSTKTYTRLNANGAQSISVTLQADLDKMEKLVKAMKKTAK